MRFSIALFLGLHLACSSTSQPERKENKQEVTSPPTAVEPAIKMSRTAHATSEEHRVLTVRAIDDTRALVVYQLSSHEGDNEPSYWLALYRAGSKEPVWNREVPSTDNQNCVSNFTMGPGLVLIRDWANKEDGSATLTALSIENGTPLWERPVDGGQGNRDTVRIYGDRIVMLGERSVEVARVDTGKTLRRIEGSQSAPYAKVQGSWMLVQEQEYVNADRRIIDLRSGDDVIAPGQGDNCVVDGALYDLGNRFLRLSKLPAGKPERIEVEGLATLELKTDPDDGHIGNPSACGYRRIDGGVRLVYSRPVIDEDRILAIDVKGKSAKLAWDVKVDSNDTGDFDHTPYDAEHRAANRGELANYLTKLKFWKRDSYSVDLIDTRDGTVLAGKVPMLLLRHDMEVWRAGGYAVAAYVREFYQSPDLMSAIAFVDLDSGKKVAFEMPAMQTDLLASTDKVIWIWDRFPSAGNDLHLHRLSLDGKVLNVGGGQPPVPSTAMGNAVGSR